MSKFCVEPDPASENKYMVTLDIIIYAEEFPKYPDFLKDFENTGNTKFFFIIPELNKPLVNLDLETAREKCNLYAHEFTDIITNCENTGDWSKFPWKNAELIYYK